MTIAAASPKKTTANLMKRLANSYMNPYVRQIVLAMVFMAIASAMTASIPLLMEPILDKVLSGTNKALIYPFGGVIFLIFITRGLSTYVHVIIMNKVGQSMVADIQKDMFAHFMRLDLAFFHANPSGHLISRVINDVTVLRAAMSDTLTALGKNLMTLVFLLAVMLSKDWQLSLISFVIVPFLVGFVVYIGRRLRKISKSIQEELSHLTDKLSQIFHGIRQVKAYNAEDYETRRAGGVIGRVRDKMIKAVRVSNMSTPVNEVLIGLVAGSIIIYGGLQVAEGAMTTGQLIAFLMAFIMAYEPVKKLAKLNNSIQMGLGAGERIFDMLDMMPSITDQRGAKDIEAKKPSITFDRVSFRYETAESDALHEISFTAKPGKVTALVGPSGGGKTTIINLIPRFYDVADGVIKVGKQDIREVKLKSLRDCIALVSQDITIFDDTIAANIAYGHPDAEEKDIVKAAKMAAAHDFIEGFPDGYQTQVGEDGVKLSGGQRQRLSIARAILHDAPVLLLDEATSALDNESEKAVRKALEALEKGRTTIVIAHRLSTVQNADEIIVLADGQIKEQGTHDELMVAEGLYEKMYRAGFEE